MVMVCLVVPALARAGGSDPRGRLVDRVKDAASGGEVRVYAAGPQDITMEIAAKGVTITRHFVGTGSETTVATAGDRVVLAVDRGRFAVTTNEGVMRLSQPTIAQAEIVRDRVRRSPAMQRALSLLERMRVSPTLPIAPLVWSARLVVQGAMGNLERLPPAPRLAVTARTRLLPIALDQNGPGYCWDEYAREAIEAFMEFEDCLRNLRWWEFWGDDACWLVYDMRAIGAFAWWIKCVGLNT